MSRTRTPAPFEFLVAERRHDGTHSSTALSRAVDRGELLRIERGVYLPRDTWTTAARWQQYLMALTAHATARPDDVFAAESALAAHGLPLLQVPRSIAVFCRTPNRAGTRRPALSTGRAAPLPRDQLPFPLRRVEPPPARGQRRDAHRAALRSGEEQIPRAALARGPQEWLPTPPTGLQAHPLPHAVLTCVPQLSVAGGVAVLDAARRGRGLLSGQALTTEDVMAHEHLLHSRRRQRAFEHLWQLSDPAAESPGESWSRVIFHEWGLQAPELQKEFQLPDGGTARVDFWWEGVAVVGEFDGLIKYRSDSGLTGEAAEDVVVREKLREDELRALGVTVVRWTWADLANPQRLIRRLRRAGVPLAR